MIGKWQSQVVWFIPGGPGCRAYVLCLAIRLLKLCARVVLGLEEVPFVGVSLREQDPHSALCSSQG